MFGVIPGYDQGPVEITEAEARILLAAAQDPDQSVYGDSIRTASARRARAMANAGLMRWMGAAESGWAAGTWLAYLLCPGWNALWRYHDDTHVDGCGGLWTPEGDCADCRARRRLDRAAWQRRVEVIEVAEREAEGAHSLLWCPEHGFVRGCERTTQKVCLLPGTPLHDGGLDRIIR